MPALPPLPGALRALLAGSIDYAGLFPPAGLALEPALRNQREYVGCEDAWMLGSFVLPVAQFGAAAEWVGLFEEAFPLRISALGAKTASAAEFAAEIGRVAAGMRAFADAHAPRAGITQLEIALPPVPDAGTLEVLRAALEAAGFAELPVFCEAASNAEVPAVIGLLAEARSVLTEGRRPLGFKLRTGGVTAAAFPTVAEVAAALAGAAQGQLPIKFTAGLHHPVRAHHDSVGTKMHGFLNVLSAALLARTGTSTADLESVLAEESASAFRAEEGVLHCGGHRLERRFIEAHRATVASLGSCSFDEPREDLAVLGLG